MNEFQHWLQDEKKRYFGELSGSKAKHYFRKFVKYWNYGDLPDKYYRGVSPPAAQTSYKWSFAGSESNAPRKAKDANDRFGSSKGGPSTTSGRIVGPAMPSASDRQFAKEREEELAVMDRQSARRRDRQEQQDRIEDQVGPKQVGREGQLEKKRVQRESNRAVQDAKDDAGLEVNDADLMGGGDDFRAMIARRDANRRRFEEKKRQERENKNAGTSERLSTMKDKDKANMDMFKAMAKERFG